MVNGQNIKLQAFFFKTSSHLHNMRDGFKQVLESVVAVVRHPTLSAKEVVVGRDELAERHATLGRLLQKVNHFSADLAQLLAKKGTCAGSVLFYQI